MPQNRNSSNPPKVMTWKKAVPILVVAAIFDALRFMFEWFWFFGPALAALYCTALASDTVGTAGGLTAFVCSLGATAAGIYSAPAITAFGVVMAMATGLIGWMVVGLFLIRSNPRIFKENKSAFLIFASSLLISEIPIINSVPAISIVLWRLYRMQIHKDTKVLQKYKQEQAAEQAQQQQQQTVQAQAAEFMQAETAQQEQEEIY